MFCDFVIFLLVLRRRECFGVSHTFSIVVNNDDDKHSLTLSFKR